MELQRRGRGWTRPSKPGCGEWKQASRVGKLGVWEWTEGMEVGDKSWQEKTGRGDGRGRKALKWLSVPLAVTLEAGNTFGESLTFDLQNVTSPHFSCSALSG